MKRLLVLSATAVIGLTLQVMVVWAGEGLNWICQGNYNCAATTCINQYQGVSCTVVAPINHPKCEFNGENNQCIIVQKNCASLTPFAGTFCQGGGCPGGAPAGTPSFLQEAGC